jgi:hypothetical protein
MDFWWKNCSVFNNFFAIDWNIMNLTQCTPTHQGFSKWYHECGKRCQTNETNKTSNPAHHDSAFSNDTASVARGVKQTKQTKQATHHVMTLPCMVSSKLKPETFNIGGRIFHLDAWWKLRIHLVWADECPHCHSHNDRRLRKFFIPKSSTDA